MKDYVMGMVFASMLVLAFVAAAIAHQDRKGLPLVVSGEVTAATSLQM